jgi:hypothetical protein
VPVLNTLSFFIVIVVFSHCPVLPRGADEDESCFTETITRKPNTSTSQHDEWSETPSVDTVLAREMLHWNVQHPQGR